MLLESCATCLLFANNFSTQFTFYLVVLPFLYVYIFNACWGANSRAKVELFNRVSQNWKFFEKRVIFVVYNFHCALYRIVLSFF